jgi:hypothetical protein
VPEHGRAKADKIKRKAVNRKKKINRCTRREK